MKIKFEDYEKLIISRAWTWQQKTKWEIEDLIAEGNLVFCKILNDYDPKKSAFSTYLFNSLQMHYGNLVNTANCQKAPKQATEDSIFCESVNINPEQETMFRQIINDLPNDAKEVVRAIFETPMEIIEILGIKKMTRNTLQKYFSQFRGWSQSRIWKAFSNIQQGLEEE